MMHRISLIAVFATLSSTIQGHYNFIRVAVNGQWKAPLQYVRNHTHNYWEASTPGGYSNRERDYNWWVNPVDKPESMRCGRDHMAWANTTDVLDVRAGDEMEFAHLDGYPDTWVDANFNGCPDGRGTCRPDGKIQYFHEGPVIVHVSKVPEGQDVHTYDGSGEWVKIYTLGLKKREPDSQSPLPFIWLPANNIQKDIETNPGRIVFKLPKELPKGQYLLRAASVWHAGFSWEHYLQQPELQYFHGEAQLYHACAHLQVDSEASGVLPKGVLIPEGFQYDQPGMLTTRLMYENKVLDSNYTYPGGQLWNGKGLVEDKPKR